MNGIDDLGTRLREIRGRIETAAQASGHAAGTITLVAVSKTFPAEAVAEAMAAGQQVFGESRAQELRDKDEALRAMGLRPTWHFIGTLQRNKVRQVVGRVAVIESVDSLELAEALDARVRATNGDGGPNPLPVFIQVHLGDEETKHGIAPEDAIPLALKITELPGLSLRGLMSVPPYRANPHDGEADFKTLATLATQGRALGLPLTELSMGMSHDFEVAIAQGATFVRVGTAIFGRR